MINEQRMRTMTASAERITESEHEAIASLIQQLNPDQYISLKAILALKENAYIEEIQRWMMLNANMPHVLKAGQTSKILSPLIQRGLVSVNAAPENQRKERTRLQLSEKIYSLSNRGQKIFDATTAYIQQMRNQT